MRVVPCVVACGLLTFAASSCTTMSAYSVNPREYPGVRLYQVYCSSCHGLTGRGDGPVEPILRGGAPDLTRISERHGGKFPKEEIRRIIDGRTAVQAHGTRQMPVWGFEFNGKAGRTETDRTVDRLVGYLETIQPGYYD
jgi:mono/diheme cytochrome c family protein